VCCRPAHCSRTVIEVGTDGLRLAGLGGQSEADAAR
jgi:hypothetical protein